MIVNQFILKFVPLLFVNALAIPVLKVMPIKLVAFDEGERIQILLLLAGSGLMLSCFENFRTGDRLKLPRLHATVVSCWLISISFVFLHRRCGYFC